MAIMLSEITKRSNRLKEETKPSTVLIENYYIKTNNNLKAAKLFIETFSNENYIEETFNVFDTIIRLGNTKDINNAANLIIETTIPKVRDAKEIQRYIKHKMGKIKGKETSIGNKIKKTYLAAPSKIDPIEKEKLNDEQALKEYTRFLNKIDVMVNCDRILENHAKISKIYNIDKFIQENTSDDKLSKTRTIIELCKFVDTYNMIDEIKYFTSLETVYYSFYKNGVICESLDIVNTVTDYFLSTHKDNNYLYGEIYNAIKNNQFLPDDSLKDVRAYFDSDIKVILDSDVNSLTSIKESNNSVNKFLHKMKFIKEYDEIQLNKDIESTLKSRKAAADVDAILEWIFVSFCIAGSITIIMALGFLATVLFVLLDLYRDEKNIKIILKEYKDIRKKILKDYNIVKDPETKERYLVIISQLEDDIKKLEQIEFNLKSNEEIKDEFNVSESAWCNERVLDSICETKTLSEYLDKYSVYDFNKLTNSISENISNISNDQLDYITKVTEVFSDMLPYNKLRVIFNEEYVKVLNKESNKQDDLFRRLILKEYAEAKIVPDNTIKINKPKTDNIIDINEVSNLNKKYEILDNVIVNIESLLYDKTTKRIFTEDTSFTSKINMLIDKVKSVATNLSDSEKTLSRTVDNSLDAMKASIEKALTIQEREAVIKGQIIPPASKIIKLAITSGVLWIISPAIAVIHLLGTFVVSSKVKANEKKMFLDEIEVELVMVNKYLRIADDKGEMKEYKELLKIKKALEKERDRIKYAKIDAGEYIDKVSKYDKTDGSDDD